MWVSVLEKCRAEIAGMLSGFITPVGSVRRSDGVQEVFQTRCDLIPDQEWDRLSHDSSMKACSKRQQKDSGRFFISIYLFTSTQPLFLEEDN